MRIGGFRFNPGLWPTLATLVLLPLLLSLGFWQLDRADQKRAFLASVELGREAAPVDLNRETPGYDQVRHHRARAVGEYDGAHQLLIENQIRDGRSGYQVLTPLRLRGTDLAVLVDRGWLPAPARRTELPDVTAPAGPQPVSGVIDSGPAPGLKLGGAGEESGWPRRVQFLDYAGLGALLPYRVLPYLIRLDDEVTGGYRRDWQPVQEMGPARHQAYAVQWFGLALALLVIYLVVNLKREGGPRG